MLDNRVHYKRQVKEITKTADAEVLLTPDAEMIADGERLRLKDDCDERRAICRYNENEVLPNVEGVAVGTQEYKGSYSAPLEFSHDDLFDESDDDSDMFVESEDSDDESHAGENDEDDQDDDEDDEGDDDDSE
ncbi:histone chaperone rtt106-like [Lactuca sativa]|uniref:histone chaperone rtt106-like n=1 Tax=Lactuca sativa TaxID=4236 RepID=UPI000CD9232F|nr:histone chaperone rtt106-like [Lactuca sativa]